MSPLLALGKTSGLGATLEPKGNPGYRTTPRE